MAEKKGLSLGMAISSIAVGAAAGVIYYHRKAEIKKLAEDILARVRPAKDADADEKSGDWDIGPGAETEGADAADVNIVDSGVSLEESVENAAESETEAGGESEAEPAPGPAGDEDEDEDDIEGPRKPWFWSK